MKRLSSKYACGHGHTVKIPTLFIVSYMNYILNYYSEKHGPRMAPVRTATKMEKSQSENPATEFAQFADQIDREKSGENLPLTEKHAGITLFYVKEL